MNDETNGQTRRRGRYRTPVQRDADRRQAVVLSLEGRSQREIGEALGVSAAVVNHELATVRRQWTAEALKDLDGATRAELQRLDDIEHAAVVGFEASKTSDQPGGDPRHLDIRVKTSARRARLLGLDSAATVNIKSVSLRGTVGTMGDVAEAQAVFKERMRIFQAQQDQERDRLAALEPGESPVSDGSPDDYSGR